MSLVTTMVAVIHTGGTCIFFYPIGGYFSLVRKINPKRESPSFLYNETGNTNEKLFFLCSVGNYFFM